MKQVIKIICAMMFLTSLFLIGSSITGRVISQSCCFGETCDPEYLCDNFNNEDPIDIVDMNLGVFFLIGSVSLYKFNYNSENKK